MSDLTSFGFIKEIEELHCRTCNELITKTNGAILLGTPVKFGVCRKRSHGVTIMRT